MSSPALLLLSFALVLVRRAGAANPGVANVSVRLVSTVTDQYNLNYAVESRIYEEDRSLMVVTHRATTGSIAVFNVSAPTAAPPLIIAWGNRSMEGQDRRGDLLVVAALGNRASNGSRLLLFNMSAAAGERGLLGGGGPIAELPLSCDGALHVKLYAQSGGVGGREEARVYAIVTSGLTSAAGADRTRVTAVDVSDALRPKEVAHASTPCKCAEGIAVVGDVAFVGSYCSNDVATLDLGALPASMPLLRARADPAYENMVSAVANGSYSEPPLHFSPLTPSRRNWPQHLLFSASYASPGWLHAKTFG